LTVKNLSGRVRHLSMTAYVQWVLGTEPKSTAPTLVTEQAADLGLLTARNPFNPAYPEALAFLDVGGLHSSSTSDRREFLGRNGSMGRPQALGTGRKLSGRAGAGLDPCACLQSIVQLEPGESLEFRVLLGQAPDRPALKALVERYRRCDLDALLAEVKAFWERTLGALRVRTPDRAMDLMLNRWLLYQTLSCRVWARTAFYQCGGAYGFRDQLQDVAALTHSSPAVVREHLLRAAGKQFKEGDVLHWWHPPLGAGVRTRITDDRLWLPYVVARYVEAGGDQAVLDEEIGYIEGHEIAAGSADLYFQPKASLESATLYEHCALALDRSLAVGRHGLPLMGTGDWNDGMNRVGSAGQGESVWLAWFLVENLRRFSATALARGDKRRAALWISSADDIVAAAESQGWDGDWYRRAFFDDGSALGSAERTECRIDAIAQSWAVLSGAAEPARATRAMAALEEYLWKKSDGLQVLLTPPFSTSDPAPGYIMGYVPGTRENGGQYNHAATWSVAAFAGLGQGAKAHELFSMLNPARMAGTRAGMQRYKLEPYVMAGDVYSQPPHVGRGGWSWYTGSAAWMHRVGVESILGLTFHGDFMGISPCIPPQWPGFEMYFEKYGARWEIQVTNPHSVCGGVKELELDGRTLPAEDFRRIRLAKDGKTHVLRVVLGFAPPNLSSTAPQELAALPGNK
jgi:cyclic beta-1,2-glucan synthetase